MGLALAKVKSDPDGVGHHEEDAGDEEHGEQRAFPASIERAEAPSDPVVTKMKSESSRLNSGKASRTIAIIVRIARTKEKHQ